MVMRSHHGRGAGAGWASAWTAISQANAAMTATCGSGHVVRTCPMTRIVDICMSAA